jgi:hypothetical protein
MGSPTRATALPAPKETAIDDEDGLGLNPETGMAERTVLVLGEPHSISVYRLAENVWVVVGDYRGEAIRVQGRSEGAAVKRWCQTARHQGAQAEEKPRP